MIKLPLSKNMSVRCIALNNNKQRTQCKNPKKQNAEYCGIHFKKLANVPSTAIPLPTLESLVARCTEHRLFEYVKPERVAVISTTRAELTRRLTSFDATIARCRDNLAKMVKLQKCIRVYASSFIDRVHGVAWKNRGICNNTTDFYSLDELGDVPEQFFFSFRDTVDGLVYGFHIESFINYIEQNTDDGDVLLNPYNRCPIPGKVIKYAHRLWNYLVGHHMESNNINLDANEADDLPPETRWLNRTVRIFQKLGMLGFQTNTDWIMHSNMKTLKTIYTTILHYWISTSTEQQHLVSQNIDVFPEAIVANVYGCRDKYYVIEQILVATNILVSSGVSVADKCSGAIIVLMAISMVIPESAAYNAWLT